MLFFVLISSVLYSQNTNPYKIFGCTSVANYEIPLANLFRVSNSDLDSDIKVLAIDFDKSLAFLLGENDSIIKTLNISPEEVLIWLSADPHSDNYPHASAYAYCNNNPIMLIDPNGKDWYRNDETGSTVWQKGNASSISIHNQTYNNIGETYSHIIDNATFNYNQNNLETINYTTGAVFQSQAPGSVNCKQIADNMTRSSGANPSSGRAGEILMANHDANGVVTTPTANSRAGVNRINSSIERGYAITIGIDYKPKQKHNIAPRGDGMTDHFMSVVGMNVNVQTGNTTYQFYDPGSAQNGSSPSNTMVLQDGFLQGNVAFPAQNRKFKVTTVRQN